LAECTANSSARDTAGSSTAETSFEVFAPGAALSCEDGEASLRTFDGGLCNFDRGFGSSTDSSARGKAATKASAGSLDSFGSGAAKEATGPQSQNVGCSFERGLDSSASSGSARASNVAALLDLTLDVGAKQLRECCGSATSQTANDSACRAKRGTKFRAQQRAADACCGCGERACDSFGSCASSAAGAGDFGKRLAQFGGEGGFRFSFVADATFAANTFKAGGADCAPKTFGCRKEGALELVDTGTGAARNGGAEAELGLAPRIELLGVVLLEPTPSCRCRSLRIVGVNVYCNVVVEANSNHRAGRPSGLTSIVGTGGGVGAGWAAEA
jgi:hypothetical protein